MSRRYTSSPQSAYMACGGTALASILRKSREKKALSLIYKLLKRQFLFPSNVAQIVKAMDFEGLSKRFVLQNILQRRLR
jgi:hypothetical protein